MLGTFLLAILTYVSAFEISRHRLALEAVALRQQLAVYKRKQPRPKLHRSDRLFYVALRGVWKNWSEALILVKPATVVAWHRAGYRLFWRWRSRPQRVGRPKVAGEVRHLIRRMKKESKLGCAAHPWGAAIARFRHLRTHRVLLSPTRQAHPGGKQGQSVAFLNNHREAIAAFDFFTAPNLCFRTLYCFFVIELVRRHILHFNVTLHPTGDWVLQQLREAFPLPCPYRYVLFDNDAKFGNEVLDFLRSSALKPIRTNIRSPWQDGTAERWVRSARRELLDPIIPLNENHLRRLGRDYLTYYHQDRTHIGLNKSTPAERAVRRSPFQTRIASTSRLGGLHHPYLG